MTDSILLPRPDSVLDDRDGILRVSGDADQPTLEFRVDDGLVFIRVLAAARQPTPVRSMTPAGGTSMNASRQWREASADTVIALFAANSPVASWLRKRGVSLLRLALLDIGEPDDTSLEAS